MRGMEKSLEIKGDRVYYFMNQILMQKFGGYREVVMSKAQKTRYFVYLGLDKMYLDVKKLYWWLKIKSRDHCVYG